MFSLKKERNLHTQEENAAKQQPFRYMYNLALKSKVKVVINPNV